MLLDDIETRDIVPSRSAWDGNMWHIPDSVFPLNGSAVHRGVGEYLLQYLLQFQQRFPGNVSEINGCTLYITGIGHQLWFVQGIWWENRLHLEIRGDNESGVWRKVTSTVARHFAREDVLSLRMFGVDFVRIRKGAVPVRRDGI